MTDQTGWIFEVVFAGSVEKREGERNEDRYALDQARLRFALSDGASVSYDSATWAELLCGKYIKDTDVSGSWVEDAVLTYNSDNNRDALPWMKQAAFDRGSFASLLGLYVDLQEQKICVSAFGDSNVMIMKDGVIVEVFPISNVEDFSRSPDLLCTVSSENKYLTVDAICETQLAFDLSTVVDEDKVAILMATDALSAWVMSSNTDARLNALFEIDEQQKFVELVHHARNSSDLKVDDTTMITIRISRDIPTKH